MSFNKPPPSAPMDPDSLVATAVFEEDDGTASNSISNACFVNAPNGLSSTSDKVIGAAAIAGGAAGLILTEPLVAVVGAAGAGALATKGGDIARASGERKSLMRSTM
jgi:hypothetical protein